MKTSPKESLRLKREVLDGAGMRPILRRMAGELLEHQPDLDHVLLVGIHTRGVPLAELLAAEIERMEGKSPHRGTIDITFYRDDLSTIGPQPQVRETQLPSPIDPYVVVLCDDVLYTGRTVRAALDELNDYGRPRAVRLAVLVDRGHRELPIQADVVGKVVPTARSEVVEVGFSAVDGGDYVRILEMSEPEGQG
jgi:pyrimidine operon attenuation protein/uracil phosphoribosyltransferase